MRRQYPALIHKDTDSHFGVSFPDFPGCVAAASTPEEALDEATQALALHVAGMAEDGEAFPEPTPLLAAREDAYREGLIAVAVVTAIVPGRSKRVNITLDEGLIEEIDAVTSNRSAFLAAAAREALGKHHA